jgi:hypothetical protein
MQSRGLFEKHNKQNDACPFLGPTSPSLDQDCHGEKHRNAVELAGEE